MDSRHWRRCEAVGAREIEKISLILSKQEWEAKKARKVSQVLREMDFLKQAQIGARLRKAVNFSPNDVLANERQERRWQQKQDKMLALLAQEFDPGSRHMALEVELREAPINPHHLGQKRQGVHV